MHEDTALDAGQGEGTAQEGTYIPDDGQSTQEPVEDTGEPIEETPASEEPSGEGSGEGVPPEETVDHWKNQYKEMQSGFTKTSTEVSDMKKQLEQFGGLESVVQWAGYLNNNPEFANWVQSQQNKNAYGLDTENLDDKTQEAVSLVEKIATQKANEIVQRVMGDKVEPLADNYKKKLIGEHFKQMDSTHPKWREVQDLMQKESEKLNPKLQDNPQFGDIEDLYWKVLRQEGRMEEVMAQTYEKRLQNKKLKATSTAPRTAGPTGTKPANNLRDAFSQAKDSLGIKGEVKW